MTVQLFGSPAAFEPVAHAVYRTDPVLFTNELTTLRISPWPADRVLLSVTDGAAQVGAAVQMHSSALLVSGLPPEVATAAVTALVDVRPDLPEVRGTPEAATAFAQSWQEVTGGHAVAGTTDLLYRLGELTPPVGVVGEWRPARDADTDLLTVWLDAFYVEAFGSGSDLDAARVGLQAISDAGGQVLLWTVAGKPVCMARLHACVAGMARIGPVYTPPEHRGHGYAAALTSVAARTAFDRGVRDVVLFADAANPVSNRVYRRIGFVPVAENVRYLLNGQ
ncbi:GNAT family N-acetyltransferase [Mycolicibacterium goodii]|uniref:Acetyltransferase n=1 Tax=Mycolicibacterium goodii TaxID=134601 RepID=A0A0K0XCF4_MYCGD|nr:acetyltransferase [Mycolicibacterium goodii]